MDANTIFNEAVKPVVALGVGGADFFSGTVTTDIINTKYASGNVWAAIRNVSATGTSTITVEACSDVSATATTAIQFFYSRVTTSTNVTSAAVLATSAGFTTAAGEDVLYQITVRTSDIQATGYQYLRIKAVEVVNDPSTGYILFQVPSLRYSENIPAAIIA